MGEERIASSGEPEDRYIFEHPSEQQEMIVIVREPRGVIIPLLAA